MNLARSILFVSIGFSALKAIPLTHQSSGIDLNTLSKENETQDSNKILIAIIDTGADINLSVFKNLLWSNPGETGLDSQGRDKSSNGFDDDANGFIDDVHGWNFIDNSSDISDQHGHGTHIAGLISANLKQGSNSKVQFMILKYYDETKNPASIFDASNRSLEYALKMGATVINYSGGGDLPNLEEQKLYNQAFLKKVLVVAAAGNEGRSNDVQGFYPASYGFENIISVASLDTQGELLKTSNFGSHSVDLGALGKDVVSTLPGNRLGKLTGTSQATAIVTGLAVSLMATHGQFKDPTLIKERLIATSNLQEILIGRVIHPRVPDLERATTMKDRNELSPGIQLAQSRISHVFDDPLSVRPIAIDREVSSLGEKAQSEVESKKN